MGVSISAVHAQRPTDRRLGEQAVCLLCESTGHRVLELVGTTQVVRCACGLAFVTPVPPPAARNATYDAGYYEGWVEQEAARARMWRARADVVEGLCDARGRLLDVGCGDGTFLDVMQTRGWNSQGTEVSPFAASQPRRFPVHAGEVWDAKLPPSSFDVVTGWHVIEHAAEPLRMLAEMYRLLRPGGRLVLATPNLDDHVFQACYRLAKGRRPPLYEEHERELHLFFFTMATFRRLAERAGFTDIAVGYDPGAAVTLAKRLIDRGAWLWYRLTGLHWGMGLQLTAVRPLSRLVGGGGAR